MDKRVKLWWKGECCQQDGISIDVYITHKKHKISFHPQTPATQFNVAVYPRKLNTGFSLLQVINFNDPSI